MIGLRRGVMEREYRRPSYDELIANWPIVLNYTAVRCWFYCEETTGPDPGKSDKHDYQLC